MEDPSKQCFSLLKGVTGRTFWEGGVPSGVNGSEPQPVPRWFVDLRVARKIRLNCMTDSTIYLRSDGKLFVITKNWIENLAPLVDAIEEDSARDIYIKEVFLKQKMRMSDDIWECAEYVADKDCYEINNIWKVAASAWRTGRFLYTATKKEAKVILEGVNVDIRWIYSTRFDQSTEEYAERYRERVQRAVRENEEYERTRSNNAYTVEFDLGSLNYSSNADKLFEVLGISRGADLGVIKKAYWEKAKKCHPDLNPGNSIAEEQFKELSIAYSRVLASYA